MRTSPRTIQSELATQGEMLPATRAGAAQEIGAFRWRQLLAPANFFFLGCIAMVYAGWRLPLHRYITPESGIGYALGILGGMLMLILLLYPARKRVRWLSFMGSVTRWFQAHMVLGVVGPICVLYHCDFSTGAVNSNVALFCMLIVSASGLFGRYFYSKIHLGLYGHAISLQELQASAQRLRTISTSVKFLPDLLDRVNSEEVALLQRVAGHAMLLRPVSAAWYSSRARRRLQQHTHATLQKRAPTAPAAQARRLQAMAYGYIAQRIRLARRIAEHQAYAQLFSWWHILHLPLFFMLLIAGIVHVAAVHVY